MRNDFSPKNFGIMLLKLVGVYLAVLLVATLLTPFFWQLLHNNGNQFTFDKIFDRLRYLGLLCMLPLLWKWAGLKNFGELGWKWTNGALWVAFGGIASVIVLGLWLGKDGFELPAAPKLLMILGRGVLTAVVVALIEEIVFRGILQRIVIRASTLWAGILIAAVIFAWLHGRPDAPVIRLHFGVPQAWELAVKYVSSWPADFSSAAFINLGLFGVALGTLYARTGKMILPMALHAGIVATAIPVSAFMKHLTPLTMKSSMFLVGQPQTTALLLLWVALAVWWPVKKEAKV